MHLSRYTTFSGPLEADDGQRVRLLHQVSTSALKILDERSFDDLREGRLHLLPPTMMASLIRDGFVVDESPAKEMRRVHTRNGDLVRTDDTYLLTVMPSSDCQMGCDYCGQSHRRGGLDDSMAHRLNQKVDAQLSEGRYRCLDVSWYGGEPLLAIPRMISMTRLFQRTAEIRGCVYRATATTNGLLLTPTNTKRLVEECKIQLFQVTLDGTREFHDTKRHLKTGGGTFATILRNLERLGELKDMDFQVQIRCNVDSSNWRSVSELIKILSGSAAACRISKFYTRRIFDWDNGADGDALSEEQYAALQIEWIRQLQASGVGTEVIPERTSGSCKVYNTDMLLIDPSGATYNCYEYPLLADGAKRESNKTGHLSDDGLPPKGGVQRKHLEVLNREGHPCMTCQVLPLCGGICEPHWKRGIRQCPDFKHNLRERLDAYAKFTLGYECENR